MKHNDSLLEPVPFGRVLGQAMTIKLTSDLIAKLMGRPRMSIKLAPSEKVLMIGDEQFSLDEAKEDKGSHDLYHQSADSIVRVASIRSRLNMQRTLNQQVAAEVREKTQQAELEYRGKKIISGVEDASTAPATTVSGKRATPAAPTRKRAAPTPAPRPDSLGRQKPGTKQSMKVQPAAPSKAPQAVVTSKKEERRRQLIHLLAASDKGLSPATLEKHMGPIKDITFVLSMVSILTDDGVYKLIDKLFKEVDPNYEGYSPADRAVVMIGKQRYLAQLAAAAKPAPSKSAADKPAKLSPNNGTSTAASEPPQKKRKSVPGEVPPEALQLAKPVACPEQIPLHKLKHNAKYANTLYPEISNYQEYESYRKKFFPKHERYKELDQLLLANSKEFTDLAHQFEKCIDREERKRLKDVIFQRLAQKKQSHQQMVSEWKALHVELTEIKDRVSTYIQEYQRALT